MINWSPRGPELDEDHHWTRSEILMWLAVVVAFLITIAVYR